MKGLRLIVAVLLLAVIFGVRPGSNLAAARLEEVVGAGEVVLGNGITLEQAEEMALIMAKRDALDQFGGYVISETVVTNHELTKDEVTAITAGIVQVKPGFKEVSKHLDGTYIVVRVKAVFLIDRADFEARLARYVEERTKSAEIAKLVERVNTMEAQLAALSKQADSSYLEAQLQISAVEQSYQDLSYALTFSGQTVFSLINDNRVQRLNRLKAYLTKLKGVADPYKMFTLSIEGQPLVEDKGEGAISITVNTKVDLNRDYCQKASRIVEEHKGDLYPVNDRVDNINSEVLGETPIFKQPLIVAFLNSNDEVVAFYYCRWPYGEYVSVEFTNLQYQIYFKNLNRHTERKGSIMSIDYYALPWKHTNIKDSWHSRLPEHIVKEITSIKLIYSKYESNSLHRNYDEYHRELVGHQNYHYTSYIYSTVPMKLADLMFTEADILKELDALIKRIDAKIGEIQGDTETNTVQFSY